MFNIDRINIETELILNGISYTSFAKALNNQVIVNSVSDLPAPSGGIITLAADTLYFFNTGTFNIADQLQLSNNSFIYGINKTSTILNYTGVSNFIIGTNINFTIRDLEIRTTTGTVFNVTNTTSQSSYAEQVNFRNCLSLGQILGGGIFWKYTLALSCTNGIIIDGTLGSVIMDTTSFRTMLGGANSYGIKVLNGTTGTSFRMYNSIVDAAATHYGLWVDGTFTLTSGAVLRGNIFSGAGTRLSGVNANTTGWEIPSRSNQGIAGLFDTNRTIVIGTLSSTTSGTWLSVTQQVLARNAITDYEPNATQLKGILSVGMTHDVAGGDVGFRLFNLTDNVAVPGSTVASVIITTGGVYEVFSSPEFDLLPGKEYRVQIIKNSGTGGQSVFINAGDLTIKAF